MNTIFLITEDNKVIWLESKFDKSFWMGHLNYLNSRGLGFGRVDSELILTKDIRIKEAYYLNEFIELLLGQEK